MSNEQFDDIKIDEEHLEHHGIKGQKWGNHNDETKRKYGELPGLREMKKTNISVSDSTTSSKPDNSRSKPSLVERGIAAVKRKHQKKKDAKAAEVQKAIDAENAAKKRAIEDEELKRKYGMTRDRYEALREVTLNSHDPRVVAKGMKLLTDEELEAKIKRLEREGKIKTAATKARKEEAEARAAELNHRKQTLPYQLGNTAAKAVTNVVVNSVTQKAFKPIADASMAALGQSGAKAIQSLKKEATQQAPKVKNQAKSTVAKIKTETAVAKISASKAKNDAKAATFGETLYNRIKTKAIKAPNREAIDADDPSLGLNKNNAPKFQASKKNDKDK